MADPGKSWEQAGAPADRTVTAMGTASRDRTASRDGTARENARDVGRSMRDVLDASVSKVGEQFRSVVERD